MGLMTPLHQTTLLSPLSPLQAEGDKMTSSIAIGTVAMIGGLLALLFLQLQ